MGASLFTGLGILPAACGVPSYLQPSEAAAGHCGRVQGGFAAGVVALVGAVVIWMALEQDRENRTAPERGRRALLLLGGIFALVILGAWLGGAGASGNFRVDQATSRGLEASGADANSRLLYFAQRDAAQKQADALAAAGGSVAAALMQARRS